VLEPDICHLLISHGSVTLRENKGSGCLTKEYGGKYLDLRGTARQEDGGNLYNAKVHNFYLSVHY